MNNENFHQVLKVPPIAHALHHWNEETRMLSYEYNGKDIISMIIPRTTEVGFRHGSDGSIQSVQYMQQVYITLDQPMKVEIKFTLSQDAINMRPHRARAGEAILGQMGQRLIKGVNGLYDVNQDLLIEFNGCNWRWMTTTMKKDLEGSSVAIAEVELGEMPFFINLKMHYYNKHLGYNYYKPWEWKPKTKPVAGWCSWEAYRRDIDIDKIKHITTFMDEKLRAYGLEYIQVDDGYQKMPLPFNPQGTMKEGWMTTEEKKFPDGHESIVECIKKHHFTPAIWTNANITNEAFPMCHKEDVIWHEGKALKGEWIDFLYSCEPSTLEKHVQPLFEAFKERGYEYVKIDAIRHLLFDGLHEAVRLGIMSNEEAERKFRAYMESTRKGLGDAVYYLASWGEMNEVIGVVDACRISMDANPTWAGIRMQLFESARWFHAQRILFLIDPDHVCVRTNIEWAKSVLSLISLSGGLYMLSDTTDAYNENKLAVIRKTLPPLTTRTAETGSLDLSYPAYTWTKLHGFAVQSNEKPVEAEAVCLKEALDMAGIFPTMSESHPFSSLWSFHLEGAGRNWCVMGRFATMPLEASTVSMETLGLEDDCGYLAFDFWEQKYLGIVKGDIECKALKVGECQVVALYEMKKVPQLIGSSRHVSMDAISVKEHVWTNEELTLRLEGIEGMTEQYYIHLPKPYSIKDIIGSGIKIKKEKTDDICKLSVTFLEKIGTMKITF
ncbi:MAG: hypothetical protein AB9856_08900 [Cellulosilyticaceae bacterium]